MFQNTKIFIFIFLNISKCDVSVDPSLISSEIIRNLRTRIQPDIKIIDWNEEIPLRIKNTCPLYTTVRNVSICGETVRIIR